MKEFQINQVSAAIASPVFFEKLAETLASLENHTQLSTLTRIFLGGAPVFPRAASKLKKAFPQAAVKIIYGSTEAEPISSIEASQLLAFEQNRIHQKAIASGLLVGKPVAGIHIAIIKIMDGPIEDCSEDAFRELSLQPEIAGEICVSGPFVLKEYYNSETAWRMNKFKVGDCVWHRTGDAGYLDQEGLLFLMGRVKQRFTYGSEQYFVFPLENRLLEVEGVQMGTVVQVDEKVYVVLEVQKDFSNLQKIRERIETELPFANILFLKKIPRDPRHNSKIDYDCLKRMVLRLMSKSEDF